MKLPTLSCPTCRRGGGLRRANPPHVASLGRQGGRRRSVRPRPPLRHTAPWRPRRTPEAHGISRSCSPCRRGGLACRRGGPCARPPLYDAPKRGDRDEPPTRHGVSRSCSPSGAKSTSTETVALWGSLSVSDVQPV